jgi:hypothetical protein
VRRYQEHNLRLKNKTLHHTFVANRQQRAAQIAVMVCVLLGSAVCAPAQQKGQWVPGQFGLNAGVIPDPGLTYENLAVNYSASSLNDSKGNPISIATGTYQFWVDENIFMYVPKYKFLGGYFAPYAAVNVANGSLVADFTGTKLGVSGGGSGLADTYVQPVNLGWHLSRADLTAGYAFVAPTGRFTKGASNNVGSGYWGNNFNGAVTFYITKNKGTSANLLTDWETHGQKTGTDIIPGRAVTNEWGIGQALPLDKQLNKLVQIGLVGYDQWQVSDNSGITRLLPYYSVHAIGGQGNFLVMKKGLVFFFKYYDEYSAKARPIGRSIVFGGSWTLKFPKA